MLLNLLAGVLYQFESSKLPPVTAKAYQLIGSGRNPPEAIFLDEGRIDGNTLRFEARQGSLIK